MSTEQPLTVVEGGLWPEELRRDAHLSSQLRAMSDQARRILGSGLVTEDQRGAMRVSYGLAGYLRLGPYQIHVVPKCFAIDGDETSWGRIAPRFLQLCRNLGLRDVLITGRGVFLPGNVLLPWWAEYYGLLLWQALHAYPYLRYEQRTIPLTYVRGQVAWPRQLNAWSQGDQRIWCSFRLYQADNPLNRLLKWTANQLMRVTSGYGARSRLGHCLDLLSGTADTPPERRMVDQLRVPASMAAYREPTAIARAIYNLQYPGLTKGDVPAEGFLIRMPAAFEAFVDGLTYRLVAEARRRGRDWSYSAQRAEMFARPEENTSYTYTTRPDNLIHYHSDDADGGIVIDAKYKGEASQHEHQGAPRREDMYQIFATCIAHQTSQALILSPALSSQDVAVVEQRWTIPLGRAGNAAVPAVTVRGLSVDLRYLRAPTDETALLEALLAGFERAIPELCSAGE